MAAPKPGAEQGATYPCPACGAPLYGWLAAHHPVDRSKLVLDRCEDCGLVVTRDERPPDVGAEIGPLLEGGESIVVANRASLQGGIGGAQWAGLEPDRHRLHLTPRAARLLFRALGVEVLDSSTPFGPRAYLGMVQTLVNGFTLRDNFARNARAGRLPRATARQRLSFALDAVVSILVVVPLAIIAAPLELVAAAIGRGGALRLRTAPEIGGGGRG
jgi:hypothetical protein